MQNFIQKHRWLILAAGAAVALSTPAVLLFSPIVVELGQQRGLSETAALSAIVLGSVGSAAGRLLMPMLSDKIGRRATDLILFGASLALSVGFLFAQSWWVVACYALLTFCYSALAAVLPALASDLFGLPHAGVNYGFLALGQRGQPFLPAAGRVAGPAERAALSGHCGRGPGLWGHVAGKAHQGGQGVKFGRRLTRGNRLPQKNGPVPVRKSNQEKTFPVWYHGCRTAGKGRTADGQMAAENTAHARGDRPQYPAKRR